jgi:hypothetical protein
MSILAMRRDWVRREPTRIEAGSADTEVCRGSRAIVRHFRTAVPALTTY